MTQAHKKKILIADPSSILLREIFHSKKAALYEIETASCGKECLEKIESFKPELVFIELLLPNLHGIEILKILKSDPDHRKIGVFIVSSLAMIQNYHAALELGADFFLTKPFSTERFFTLIEKYFSKTLLPEPFKSRASFVHHPQSTYHTYPEKDSYIKFWGTRGSSPVSGPSYIRHGGNTSCLEIKSGDDLIIFDAGTGIRELGELIHLDKQKKIPLIIGHTHWDHITGFPFFAPLYHKECDLEIFSPVGYQKETEELFSDMLAFGYFPVRLDEMFAHLKFTQFRDGSALTFGNITIISHYAHHPGPTLCFKIITPTKTIGYVTDNELLLGFTGSFDEIHKNHPLLEPHLSLLNFLDDCEILIHEAQYFPEEYAEKAGWGHSSVSNAVAFIQHLKNCKEWIVTHHDPKHTDDDLMKKMQVHIDLLEKAKLTISCSMAYDGMIITF